MFVAVVATVLVGCADGAAPVIENLEVDQMEIVVGVENTVSFTLDFSDSDGDVAQAQVEIVRQDDGTVLLSSATPIEGAAGVEAGRFTGGVSITPQEAGFFYFRVTVIDETANESNALSESIEIVEALSE
jgi:hypothetical protein